jgi:hypothetical protein
MKPHPTDLTKTYPRSVKEVLGGMVHLARMIDKARAKAAGRLGEYIYPCPLDDRLLAFLGIDAERFYEAAQSMEEEEIVGWIRENGVPHSPEAVEEWNRSFLERRPQDEDAMKRFLALRDKIAPDREDVMTWVDLLDLDEGREVKTDTPSARRRSRPRRR